MSPPENPYAEQTQHNTRIDWLSEQQPLDVDIGGMTDYAGNMQTLSKNLEGLQRSLNLLGTTPTDAWDGAALSEMNYMRHRFLGNYAELAQYLSNLQAALMAIGMAAQTVADAYHDTDGSSATSVDAVRFAFGDRTVPTPAGLPAGGDYPTLLQHHGGPSQPDLQPERPEAAWSEPVRKEQAGVITYTSTNQFGETRVQTQEFVPGRGYVYTTTVTDSNGNVVSESRETRYSDSANRYVHMSGSTTTTTRGDVELVDRTHSTRVINPEGGHTETTTNYRDGEETGTTIHEVDAEGNQVITNTRPDDEGNPEVVREIHIGADTESASPGDSPAQAALRGADR